MEALNQSATHPLEELIDPGSPGPGVLPEVVYAVAEEARRAAAGDGGHGPVRHRLPTRTGSWVIPHGTLLEVSGRGRR